MNICHGPRSPANKSQYQCTHHPRFALCLAFCLSGNRLVFSPSVGIGMLLLLAQLLAKTNGSLLISVFLRVINNNTGQEVSLFTLLVYNRNGSPLNPSFSRVTMCLAEDQNL